MNQTDIERVEEIRYKTRKLGNADTEEEVYTLRRRIDELCTLALDAMRERDSLRKDIELGDKLMKERSERHQRLEARLASAEAAFTKITEISPLRTEWDPQNSCITYECCSLCGDYDYECKNQGECEAGLARAWLEEGRQDG